jgi:hypothetical protein
MSRKYNYKKLSDLYITSHFNFINLQKNTISNYNHNMKIYDQNNNLIDTDKMEKKMILIH